MCTQVPPGVVDGMPVDENGQPLSKNALKKLAKAEAIAAKKAKKIAEKAAVAAVDDTEVMPGSEVGGKTEEPVAPYSFRDLGVLMSAATPEEQRRIYSPIRQLGEADGIGAGGAVWVRGRVSRLRAGASNCFLVLRSQGQYTVQAVFFKDKATPTQSKAMLESLAGLTEESIVDIYGNLVEAQVKSCSQSNVEVRE